ncbi:3-dehydroquinate synthase [bacterium]|jgi:3-dehydroquinate synthase|nr:3-dehydroquinate synthase [bacterium]
MSVITVELDSRTYPILIGSGMLSKVPQALKDAAVGQNVAIITHPEIWDLYGATLSDPLTEAGYKVSHTTFPSGETHKTWDSAKGLLDFLLDHRLERNDTVIALGGGIVGDVAGFVASTYLRGIHLVQCPTTLLAQVDASIGGKTGVNHPAGKNLIGSFYQPLATVSDISTLASLPPREVQCGLAEVIKYGIISDPQLFKKLESQADTLSGLDIQSDPALWTSLIERSSEIKAHIVSHDEREKGQREILNLGHTIGHAIEAAYDYKTYLHGEGVALGILAEGYIAVEMGCLSTTDYDRISSCLDLLGFPSSLEDNRIDTVLPYLYTDKKIKDGKIRYVLPSGIGHTTIRDDVPEDLARESLEALL